ncbi:hypothetical protein H5410_057065 [Solanum commersonii]|uniref:Uncharacterized protein n=1 Tax=Solanum commersonii TaxID=4109 RepID=A0A9J5WLY6_SOLCO|nr:hypothetical protein H5410_057065 [Solanum commersonii]
MNILDSLKYAKVKEKIKLISKQIAVDICADHPNAFWNRKKHIVTLSYEEGFSEDDIPTKSQLCQMKVGHTALIKDIKLQLQCLSCLYLANPAWQKIIETDACNIGYGGFHFGKWNEAQYAIVAHAMLTIVKCVLKFQDDLYKK